MQKANMKKGFIFLPVPAEVAQELNLDPFGTIQYTISKGRLIKAGSSSKPSMQSRAGCASATAAGVLGISDVRMPADEGLPDHRK